MTRRHSAALGAVLTLLAIYTMAYLFELKRVAVVQVRSIATRVAELDRQIKQLSFTPRLLSSDPHIVTAIGNTNAANTTAANRRLSTVQTDSRLDFAFLMNSSGITVAASNWQSDGSFIGNDYSFRPYFTAAIKGRTSSYFAVGATTGIPGYFIAEPVINDDTIDGVVVAKMALTAPVDTWREFDFHTVVLDEFGVVILSSADRFLYQPTRALSADDIAAIQHERRYPVTHLQSSGAAPMLGNFRHYAARLQTQPWQLMTLVAKQSYHKMAAFITAVAFTFFYIALLLLRIYRQQQRLVASEQRHSKELEAQVRQRTRELELAQDALIAESNYAMLGKMSAAINHEINQPLASLRLNLASLRKLIESPQGHTSDIEDIVVESDRTTKRIGLVINTLRNYTRGNSLRLEIIDLGTLAREVTDTVKTERPTMSKHLSVTISSDAGSIEGDRVLLQQALLNLLYNAIDAVLPCDNPLMALTVSAALPGRDHPELSSQPSADNHKSLDLSRRFVSISVSDNGGGVATDMIPTLFEPFSTAKSHHRGLGLGLTIARQIADSHRGQLLYSQLPDGSRFSLLLPIADKP